MMERGIMQVYSEYASPIGDLTIASNGEAVVGLWFAKHRYMDEALSKDAKRADDDPVLKQLANWLDAYFANKRPAIDELPLEPAGTDFRQDVWQALRQIPYGETVTYGELAEELRRTRGNASPRSVGGAVGHNPVSIVVPCHRVVGADGSLTGFGGGIDAKVALLTHEGVDMSRFTIPTKGTAL